MTVYYVDDTATGLNNGTSLINAYTSVQDTAAGLLDLETLNAGDEVRIRSTHNEVWDVTNVIFDWTVDANARTNPVRVISIDGSENYLAGARLYCGNSRSMSIAGEGIAFHGVDHNLAYTFKPVYVNNETRKFVDCNLSGGPIAIGGTSPSYTSVEFINCVFSATATAIPYRFWGRGTVTIKGGSLSTSGLNSADSLLSVGLNSKLTVEDCDLTGSLAGQSIVFGANNTGAVVHLRRCKLHANMDMTNETIDVTAVGSSITFSGCYTATDTVPQEWRLSHLTNIGRVDAVKTEVRTGGATDGTTQHSWECVPIAAVNNQVPLKCPTITKYVAATGSNQTLTINFASTVAVNDDEVWFETESPSEAATADAQARWQTTKPAILATPTAYTDLLTGDWSGTGVGFEMSKEITINPTEAGVVKITAFVAKNQTVFIDPLIVVT